MHMCARSLVWMQRSVCAHKCEYEWVCVRERDYTVLVYYCVLMSLLVCVSAWVHQRYIPPGSHWLFSFFLFFFFKCQKYCFLSFCNVQSWATVDQHGNLAFSLMLLLMFYLLPFFILGLLSPPPPQGSSFIYQTAINMCQLGCSSTNEQVNDSFSTPALVCKILDGCQICVLVVWLCACICAFLLMVLSIYEACLCMCVHCRQFAHIHTLSHTHKWKKTKPISLFQTHQWNSWGSLVQSKTTILRCRQDPVNLCGAVIWVGDYWRDGTRQWGLSGSVLLWP